MAYRYDPDLDFLQHLESDDLKELYDVLVYDKDGDRRLTETLSVSNERKEYGSNYSIYWERIAEELQCYGANTFVTLLRFGKGVTYHEILCDVCDKLKVNYNKNSAIEKIEQHLLMKILEKSLEEMSSSEKQELARSIGIKNTDNVTPELLTAAFLKIFKLGGFKSYQLTVIVVNAILKALIGRGLSFAGNATLTRTMAVLTGPIGWVITGLWTAIDIAGPAYRVTIPAVITVIGLRQKYINRHMLSELNIE
ncbi:DUF3944 domain-containing protein [Pasteurella atlantica]|uniref:DUF3944 domain-containing protein n=1 Tax=Pasteurellaceae TaxID=712 RepID=UPI00276AD2C3|nr:DUF3944 domain-containing protein [Pasteurella atlantica]MDP8033828.1 DUF3944 domain-containing protein [Pasteurella atlantica]MDP8035763.1 DUF3944 domain-containing protein [Pasteurella atlantica]MDP8037702.1 DUF3944 domain-containing protein [Pasteurella atlantica]MDP8048064.1 DUF3944 domain-containing protein [Pasteurella atlantica]MDP8050087.1 DUF3944 domain-containing protein [Pasteurella atlantica]